MKITEVYIKNFGKLYEKKISFHDGINLFYGENESGKTTIHTFIKSMLFGMDRGRGRAAATDTFRQYEPWENPNYYAGMLRFTSGGKNFCLTRNFDRYGKSASLICEDDGEEFSLETGDLEVILPGITETNYENTIAIGQMKVETNQGLAKELQNYATNYYATGNSDIDLVGAMEILTKQRKDLEREIRSVEQLRNQNRRDKERDKDNIRQEITALEEKIRRLDQEIKEEQDWKREFVEVAQEEVEEKRGKRRYWDFVLLLLGMMLAFRFLPGPWQYVGSGILILIEAAFIWGRYKKKKGAEFISESTESHEEDQLPKLLLQKEIWEEEFREKQVKYENIREELSELDEKDEVYQRKEKKREALEYAMNQLEELSKEMNQEIGQRMNERVSQIVKEITNGKYELVRVDKDLKINVYTQGRMVNLDQLSRGAIEQIYFALRMAAGEVLHEEEYPIILDDTFVYYDDKRLKNTLKWLKENKQQVILFTCQKREEQALNG